MRFWDERQRWTLKGTNEVFQLALWEWTNVTTRIKLVLDDTIEFIDISNDRWAIRRGICRCNRRNTHIEAVAKTIDKVWIPMAKPIQWEQTLPIVRLKRSECLTPSELKDTCGQHNPWSHSCHKSPLFCCPYLSPPCYCINTTLFYHHISHALGPVHTALA